MFNKLLNYLKDRYFNTDPYEDSIQTSINGTPLVVLVTPKPFSYQRAYIKTTETGLQSSKLFFGIQMDFGKYLSVTIEALEGRHNSIFSHDDLKKILDISEKVLKTGEYSVFKHNGKPHMELVKYSLDPRGITKLRQAVQTYHFNLL